jgi:hypothetical protein
MGFSTNSPWRGAVVYGAKQFCICGSRKFLCLRVAPLKFGQNFKKKDLTNKDNGVQCTTLNEGKDESI